MADEFNNLLPPTGGMTGTAYNHAGGGFSNAWSAEFNGIWDGTHWLIPNSDPMNGLNLHLHVLGNTGEGAVEPYSEQCAPGYVPDGYGACKPATALAIVPVGPDGQPWPPPQPQVGFFAAIAAFTQQHPLWSLLIAGGVIYVAARE